jgi:hypothetical protein
MRHRVCCLQLLSTVSSSPSHQISLRYLVHLSLRKLNFTSCPNPFLIQCVPSGLDISVTLQARIREETDSPEWGFAWFSSVPPGKFRNSTTIRSRLFPSKSFPLHDTSVPPVWALTAPLSNRNKWGLSLSWPWSLVSGLWRRVCVIF